MVYKYLYIDIFVCHILRLSFIFSFYFSFKSDADKNSFYKSVWLIPINVVD